MGEKTQHSIIEKLSEICQAFKGRAAGTEAERNCQQYFCDELNQYADDAVVEEFDVHPRAFMGWIFPVSILALISIACFWMRLLSHAIIWPVIGGVCITIACIVALFEFLLYIQFIDVFFPKKRSSNVFARRAPSGELKRRIVFCGHTDAAYEMTYVLHHGRKNIIRIAHAAMIGLAYVFVVNIIAMIIALTRGGILITGIWLAAGIGELVFIPIFIDIMFFVNWFCIVDGANDNLSGCLVAMGVLEDMAKRGIRMKNTEVCCLLTGSEEAGLRGSTAFAKKHRRDFDDVETIFVVLDTLREIEHMQVYTRGINGLQANSKRVSKLIVNAAQNCGVTLKEAMPYPGATDAEAFSRAGFEASAMCGINHDPRPYYHTRYDTPDNVDTECIMLAHDIAMEIATLYDEEGLPR
ncbi:M20/M25/M40 family metallo-hydrolase [Eubacteriales bacterium OttesenSCG-928-N14]|nr:M20/M25/M40 family metallo-hydrolase [Eubacteriales bacterium OttesenSCG-928-N14]